MSGGQVVEPVEMLQEPGQERDGARLLHQARIDGEEEDDGHHQLWQEHTYTKTTDRTIYAFGKSTNHGAGSSPVRSPSMT